MNIKVIGSGCENCDKTNAVVKECLEELGIDTEIERVTDLVEIVKLGVMTAPSVMMMETGSCRAGSFKETDDENIEK